MAPHANKSTARRLEADHLPPAAGRSNVGRKDQPVLIAEKSVSRNHGYVTSDGKTLKVGDGGSKFGTHVDGKKVSSESEVKEGQVIRFGGREDGSADFRASKESVLIALTACGEKHAAFKTQALTCGSDVIGEARRLAPGASRMRGRQRRTLPSLSLWRVCGRLHWWKLVQPTVPGVAVLAIR